MFRNIQLVDKARHKQTNYTQTLGYLIDTLGFVLVQEYIYSYTLAKVLEIRNFWSFLTAL